MNRYICIALVVLCAACGRREMSREDVALLDAACRQHGGELRMVINSNGTVNSATCLIGQRAFR